MGDHAVNLSKGTLLSHLGTQEHRYVNRGSHASVDFDETMLTDNTSFNNIDLSSVVPKGAVAVHLYVFVRDNAVGSYIQFRKNGQSGSYPRAMIRTQVTNAHIYADIIVACDEDAIIEAASSPKPSSWTDIDIDIKGWFI